MGSSLKCPAALTRLFAAKMGSPGPAIGGAMFAMEAQGSYGGRAIMYGEDHSMGNDWGGIGTGDNFEGTVGTSHRRRRSRVQKAVT